MRAPTVTQMTLHSSTAALPPRNLKRTWGNVAAWAVIAGLLAWSWDGADMRPGDLIESADNMLRYIQGFFPPNFHDWRIYMDEMLITVQIAVWGTALAVVLAVPFGVLSSANIVPWWVYQPVRRLMDAFRAINEIVFAILFVSAVGLGPFAGVLALWIHTTGILAKLFSEAVEAIDPRPVEGIRATGATRVQEVVFGVIPQVMPLWISFTLYRFESNLRSATVLGIVGAGGIGQILYETIRGFYYAETAAIMLIIIVVVSLVDIGSQVLRKRFV